MTPHASHDGHAAAPGFATGQLWIGEHTADGDILILDPAETDATAERLSLYSLTQLRHRVFPRSVVAQRIHPLTDQLRVARAKKDYGRRAELRAAHERAQEAARVVQLEQQRQAVIELHRRYLDRLGIAYPGVQETPAGHRSRRAVCHACKIALDDFTGSMCSDCKQVLCSCGACGCRKSRLLAESDAAAAN